MKIPAEFSLCLSGYPKKFVALFCANSFRRKIISIANFGIIFLCLLFSGWYSNNPGVIISKLPGVRDIREVSELKYRVYFLGVIPAGEAVFYPARGDGLAGKESYHLRATANTASFFSGLFSARAFLDSFVDIHRLVPFLYRFKLNVSGRKEVDEEIVYNQEDGSMYVSGARRLILPNTQDPLSAMFNIMRMDFEKSKELQMNINTHKKNYIFEGIALNKDLSVNSGIYKTYIVKGKVFRQDKNPYHQSSVTFVLLRGKVNVPCLIEVFSGGVLIKARLVGIKGE